MTTKEQIKALDRDIEELELRMASRYKDFTKLQNLDAAMRNKCAIERDKLCRQRIEELDKERAQ